MSKNIKKHITLSLKCYCCQRQHSPKYQKKSLVLFLFCFFHFWLFKSLWGWWKQTGLETKLATLVWFSSCFRFCLIALACTTVKPHKIASGDLQITGRWVNFQDSFNRHQRIKTMVRMNITLFFLSLSLLQYPRVYFLKETSAIIIHFFFRMEASTPVCYSVTTVPDHPHHITKAY